MKNVNHNGYPYAETRYARDFLQAMAEYRFSCQLLGMANTRQDDWDQSRAMKCVNGTRRKMKLAKNRLDRYRRRIKKMGGCCDE